MSWLVTFYKDGVAAYVARQGRVICIAVNSRSQPSFWWGQSIFLMCSLMWYDASMLWLVFTVFSSRVMVCRW